MTAVIIVARDSAMTLDDVAEVMTRLNDNSPSHAWPDMVAVLSKGFVHYATRLPGDDACGDFFLPPNSRMPGAAPPLYITKNMLAAGDHTFNKVMAFVLARLRILDPAAPLLRHDFLQAGLPRLGVSTNSYQFDLSLCLRRLTDGDLAKQYMPGESFDIVVAPGKTLGSIQFQAWQDGGVFVIRGVFPLELFLIFLRLQVPSLQPDDLRFIRRGEIQVSNVLPITAGDFAQTLRLAQSRMSGMSIRKSERKIVIQKLADEGTSSPFAARLMLGILKIRDIAAPGAETERFDKAYDPAITAVITARDTANDVPSVWRSHAAKIASGEIVEVHGSHIHITEKSIERQLKRDVEGFINASARALKQGMQHLAGVLKRDIGFLFKKENAYRDGIARLRATDPLLADYLAQARGWSERLLLVRNQELEHGHGVTIRIVYRVNGGRVAADEPIVGGVPLEDFVTQNLDRLLCFVEDVTVHCLQLALGPGLAITEVALQERSIEAPERFRLTIATGGRAPWRILPHRKRFEET